MTTFQTLTMALSLLLFSPVTRAVDIEEAEFKSIERMGKKVLDMCPPDECMAISLGRSPTAIAAYLEKEKPDYMKTLPLSKFKYGPNAITGTAWSEKLYPHFLKYLPTHHELKKPGDPDKPKYKRLLIVDFLDSGESLASSSIYIKKFVSEFYRHVPKENHPEVQTVGMVASNSENPPPIKGIDFLVPMREADNLFYNKLERERYDPYARLGKFDLKKHITTGGKHKVVPNEVKFQEMVTGICKARIKWADGGHIGSCPPPPPLVPVLICPRPPEPVPAVSDLSQITLEIVARL